MWFTFCFYITCGGGTQKHVPVPVHYKPRLTTDLLVKMCEICSLCSHYPELAKPRKEAINCTRNDNKSSTGDQDLWERGEGGYLEGVIKHLVLPETVAVASWYAGCHSHRKHCILGGAKLCSCIQNLLRLVTTFITSQD